MSQASNTDRRPVFRAFPPFIYAALAGSALAIVVICWIFFAEDLASAVPTAAITIFTFIWLILPFAIWGTSGSSGRFGFRDWLQGRVEIWQTWLKGRDAAILALLPPMSVVVGLAVISLIAQIMRSST